MRQLNFALTFLSATLVACSAGSGGSDPAKAASADACTTISGGGTVVSWTFPNGSVECEIGNPDQAADGSTDTAATIATAVVLGGDCAVRVTAQPGVVYPAGNVASVLAFMNWSGASTPSGDHYAVARTYLQGVAQDEVVFSQANPGVIVDGTHSTEKRFFDVPTTKPFDAVELSVGSPGREESVQLYEFCSQRRT